MSLARVGGALVAAGGLLGMVAMAIAALGVQVRWAEACWQWAGCDRQGGGALGVPHLIGPATFVLLGIGAVVLGIAGQRPAQGRAVRVGLVVLGLSLGAYVFATNLPLPEGTDPASSLLVIAGLFGGAIGMLTGLVVTGSALIGVPGPPRVSGVLVLAGMLALPIGALLGGLSPDDLLTTTVGAAIALAGGLSFFAGFVLLGLVALQDGQAERPHEASIAG